LFHQRDILGVPVFVAKEGPLKKYLDKFNEKIKPHVNHLNSIEVVILK
jgi:hypothetical protein